MNEQTLLKIARLAAPNLKTLKIQNRDALDFVEVHVLALKSAIRAAYDLGRIAAEKRRQR